MRPIFIARASIAVAGFVSVVAFAQEAAPTTKPDALRPPGQSAIVRLWPGETPATSPVDVGDVAAIATLGCDREDREFHAPDVMGNATDAPSQTSVVAGMKPAGAASKSPPEAVDPNQFERNAFHLSEGQRLYTHMNCNGCHAHGGGDIGPPLADTRWVYGDQPEQVYASIAQGRVNGMPAYGPRLRRRRPGSSSPTSEARAVWCRRRSPGREDHLKTTPPPNSTTRPSHVEPNAPSPLPGTREVS